MRLLTDCSYLQGMMERQHERGYMFNVHHDGVFMYQPLRYENGQSYSLTIPRSSYMDLINFVEKDTTTVFNALYFALPGTSLESGLMKIENDSDIDILFDVGDSYGLIDMYVDYFGDDLSAYLGTHENSQENANAKVQSNVESNVISDVSINDMEKEKVQYQSKAEEENVGDVLKNEMEEEEKSDDDDSVHSIDRLLEGEDYELLEVRKKKAEGKRKGKIKAGPSYDCGENVGDDAMRKKEDNGCDLKVEHDEFIDELMKALKTNKNEGNENPFTENKVDEKFPIHDLETH